MLLDPNLCKNFKCKTPLRELQCWVKCFLIWFTDSRAYYIYIQLYIPFLPILEGNAFVVIVILIIFCHVVENIASKIHIRLLSPIVVIILEGILVRVIVLVLVFLFLFYENIIVRAIALLFHSHVIDEMTFHYGGVMIATTLREISIIFVQLWAREIDARTGGRHYNLLVLVHAFAER